MDRLFPEGALVFEVGAGTGDMVAGLLAYGAGTVIAVEPGSDSRLKLRDRYRDDERVIVVPKAVGEREGRGRLAICKGLCSGSTLAPEVGWGPGTLYSAHRPEAYEDVPMTTFDTLIETYGTPAFVNLTVVSYEWQALCGLSYPLPHLAFAVTHATVQSGWAERAIDRVLEIAPHAQFNYGDRDALRYDERGELYVAPMRWGKWKGVEYVKPILLEIDELGLWGRIHAKMA